MAEFPTYEQMAKNVAEKALDEFLYDGKSIREWMKIIAEQEPCDDAISRQAAILLASIATMSIDETVEAIKRLPSVRPQEQTGHWINKEFRKEEYVLMGRCSVCGLVRAIDEYCPNCGAKMVEPTCDTCKYNTATFMPCNACDNKSLFEPQESEDKE